MSFYDDASLVFLPSGEAGKDGKAYSMKPTNGNGDFTFSRGSNLTSTRIDSNGLIEKGRENLLYQSNQFDTTWTRSASDLTSGQSGYDGSSDAWLLTAATPSGFSSRLNQVLSPSSSGVLNFSVYAKANTLDWILLDGLGTNGFAAWFDVRNGVKGQVTSTSIGSKITSVGNGWYRCEVFGNATTLTEVRIYVTDSNGTTTANDGDGCYIQDAQLEQGLVATEYIESGATTGKAGLLEDSPRFDYSGGASCPSLLLEPSRTNLIDYSEAIEFGISTNECTQTITNQTNPSGNNVSYLASAIDSVNDQMRYDKNGLSSGSYFLSAFVKGDGNTNRIRMRGTGGGVTIGNVYWDVAADGTTTLNTSLSPSGVNAITEDYGDGWYRIGFEETFDGSSTSRFAIYPSNGDVNASTYIWGVQWEQGSYPTSYIPNHSGGSVTRNADVNTLLNQSGVIGQTAGTILFDAYFDEADKVNFSISDSTSSNYILIDTTSGKQVFVRVQQGGSTQATISTSGSFFTEGDRLKCAIAYDDRDMAFYINGTQVGTAAPNLIPACDDVRFSRWNGALAADQRVNRVVLFTTRISNANLATLTS